MRASRTECKYNSSDETWKCNTVKYSTGNNTNNTNSNNKNAKNIKNNKNNKNNKKK